MRIIVAKDYENLSKQAAIILAGQIIHKPHSVLGLATGSTPVGTYRQLVEFYNQGLLDFSQVKTFNLDEYYSVAPQDEFSYHWFMQENLFRHVNVIAANLNVPNGLAQDVAAECSRYEALMEQAGGIDLQLLGIGRNGHIGFNEPGSDFAGTTHLVDLDEDTIAANARFFASPDQVPRQAISMGIKSIMRVRKILLLANGSGKARIIRDMAFGSITPKVPASVLQLHPDVTVIVDEEAGSLLPR